RNLRTGFRLGCNLLVLDADSSEWEKLHAVESKDRIIDVWWRENKTGELMLLLAHIMTRNAAWRGSRIRVLADPGDETHDELKAKLAETLETYPIDAKVVAITITAEEIARISAEAALLFLPFSIHAGVLYGPAGDEVYSYLKRLPVAVLALAAQDVDLDADPDVSPEESTDPADGGVHRPPSGDGADVGGVGP